MLDLQAMALMRAAAAVLLAACLPGGWLTGSDMVFPGESWQAVPPESRGVDPDQLTAAVEYLAGHAPRDGVNQLLIVRHGRAIHAGPKVDEVHGIWSCTKSFTSTVLGLLVDDGACTLDTRAARHVPGMTEDYPQVTLRHFTTMTSGYRAQGDEPRGPYTHGPSRTPFLPGPPLFAPGSKYAYWDSSMNQFANVLTQIAGEPIEELFRRRIAGPIGMDPAKWNWGDFGEVEGITVNGGAGNQGKHILISAAEMARFGHLFLNNGSWDGKRLLSEEWIDRATRTQVPAGIPLGHPESGIQGPGMYGFNWWTNGVKPGGGRKWPGVPIDAYAASGHNNNDMFVIPSWSMVVVRLGLDQSGEDDFAITDETYAAFLRLVGEAIE